LLPKVEASLLDALNASTLVSPHSFRVVSGEITKEPLPFSSRS
jgi:hypothetical protein